MYIERDMSKVEGNCPPNLPQVLQIFMLTPILAKELPDLRGSNTLFWKDEWWKQCMEGVLGTSSMRSFQYFKHALNLKNKVNLLNIPIATTNPPYSL